MPLNKALLTKIVNQIVSQPETYTVVDWVQHEAVLGLTPEDARYLSSSDRTISQIHRRASELINGDERGYYRYGRDRYGYDRDGLDRDGRYRDGYDRSGYDRDDRDRDGYGLDGIDRDGRDRDGYDRYGINRYGVGRDGYDRDGRDRDGRDRDGNRLPPIVVDDE